MAKQTINIGATANDTSGDSIRAAFKKVNENFTELYASVGTVNGTVAWDDIVGKPAIPTNTNQLTNGSGFITAASLPDTSKLVNATKEVVLTSAGTLNVPSPTSNLFALNLTPTTYVPTVGKPTLTLTGPAWQFQGQFVYTADGNAELLLDNPFPQFNNPGYVSGDEFAFDVTAHGVPGFILTLVLNDVVLPGGAGWTANVAASQPPGYPSTVQSSGAVKLTANTNSWTLGTNGVLTLPVGGDIVDSTGISVLSNPIPGAIANGIHEVSIDTLGNIIYPGDIKQGYQDATNCVAGVETVIYTATGQFQHAIKLFVMAEGSEDGSGTWQTQGCDIIAVKGFVDNIVHITAYGVTYSSSAPLATFDAQWNVTTSRIEITCIPTHPTNSVWASVHAIEMTTND